MVDVAGVVRDYVAHEEVDLAFTFAIEHLNHDEIRVQAFKYMRAKRAHLQGRIDFREFATIEVVVVRKLLQLTQVRPGRGK